jgi:nicotinamide-nucleotide amidase
MTARGLVDAARARGLTIGVAESLTGGLVCARVVDVPGASDVLRGGVVAYATDLKTTLLDVEAGLLADRGPVDPEVAVAMAAGVRRRTGADVGLATTGVAGPGPQDGVPAGTVFVAVVTPAGPSVRELACPGDRDAVRRAAVDAVLGLALQAVSARS